jgi:hypothetical protein
LKTANAVWPIDNSKNKVSDLESKNSWFTVEVV